MKRPLRYHPLFADDVLAAAGWYESRGVALGGIFVDRVEEAIGLLVQDPERRSPEQFGIRYWPLRKFPFVVFYEVTTDEILIVGVIHTARNAEKWVLGRRP